MKYLFFSIIIICLSSCGGGKSYSHMVDPIFASYGKEMKKKRGYWVMGTGGSMPNEEVKSIFISFVGIYKVDIQSARRMYIEVVEGFIKKVNDDKTIRPYLHDYPATSKNMDIFLGFAEESTKKSVKPPYIAFVFCYNDMIYYNIYENSEFKEVFDEPYEVALKIVLDEQNALQITNEPKP